MIAERLCNFTSQIHEDAAGLSVECIIKAEELVVKDIAGFMALPYVAPEIKDAFLDEEKQIQVVTRLARKLSQQR